MTAVSVACEDMHPRSLVSAHLKHCRTTAETRVHILLKTTEYFHTGILPGDLPHRERRRINLQTPKISYDALKLDFLSAGAIHI